MLMNNLDPEVAEQPDELVVYGGTGKAARSWEAFDVIVANILANPIISLAPSFARRLRCGGRIVLSGILDAQADAVIAAHERWFNIRVCESEDGWVALAGMRTGSVA